MSRIKVIRPTQFTRTTVKLPSSKSITNRLLILNALSGGRVCLENISVAQDAVLLSSLLQRILACERDLTSSAPVIIDADNTGTAYRFLTAYLTMQPGIWVLTGSARMKQRPIKPLVDALVELGASISYLGRIGFPPLQIEGSHLQGGVVTIDASESSQFISALMLVAPVMQQGLQINFSGNVASLPYIHMTASILRTAGINVIETYSSVRISPQAFKNITIAVEPDWSAASYWFEMVAISKGMEVLLKDLPIKSLQGDSILVKIFRKLGVKTTAIPEGILLAPAKGFVDKFFGFDFTGHPDLVPAIAACCTAMNIAAHFKGTSNLRIKESDRLAALKQELAKINPGIMIANNEDFVIPFQDILNASPQLFSTYNDHRIAMALAPLSLICNEVTIENPKVVAKSYPNYWKDIEQAGFSLMPDA